MKILLQIGNKKCEANPRWSKGTWFIRRLEKNNQFSSVAESCPTFCDPMDCSMPGFSVHHLLPELAQTHVHQVGDAIQLSHPLLPPSPPAFNLSQHQDLFKWVSSSHQVAKYWSFSFSISPSNDYSGLIFFRMDWFEPLVVQGTLKSLLQLLETFFSRTSPQFKSINSLVLSCLYSPTLTSIHDYWKNHSFDYNRPLSVK